MRGGERFADVHTSGGAQFFDGGTCLEIPKYEIHSPVPIDGRQLGESRIPPLHHVRTCESMKGGRANPPTAKTVRRPALQDGAAARGAVLGHSPKPTNEVWWMPADVPHRYLDSILREEQRHLDLGAPTTSSS